MASAAVQQFWAVALNGTPPYCTPYNTVPILDPKDAESYLFLQEVTAILPIPFMVLGILTNLVFLLAILRASNMRSGVNVYLGNLAVVDIMFLTTIAGVYIHKKFYQPVIYNENLFRCYFKSAADAVVFYAGVALVTLAIVNHICAVTSAGFADSKVGNSVASLASWAVAIGFGVLAAIQYGKMWLLCFVWPKYPIIFQYLPNGYEKCAPGPIEDKNYALYLDLIKVAIFIAGLLIHIILCVLLCMKGSSGDNPDVAKQVSRMLIVNGLIFFLCHTINRVLNVFNALEVFGDVSVLDFETTSLLTLAGNGLVYLNSAVRPVVYAICSGAYRKGFAAAITGNSAVESDDLKEGKDNTT